MWSQAYLADGIALLANRPFKNGTRLRAYEDGAKVSIKKIPIKEKS